MVKSRLNEEEEEVVEMKASYHRLLIGPRVGEILVEEYLPSIRAALAKHLLGPVRYSVS